MVKLKFPIQKIKEFLDLASRLGKVDSNTLSTGDYIKVEITFAECFLTKNTLESFIEYKFDVPEILDDISFLLHESKLKEFCNTLPDAKYLFLQVSDTKTPLGVLKKEIKVSDSEKMKDTKKLDYDFEGSDNTIKIELFPATKFIRDCVKTTLTPEIISMIKIASFHASIDNLKPVLTYVYLGSEDVNKVIEGKNIFAFDYNCFYFKSLNQEFLPIAISKKEVDTIYSLGTSVSYNVNDNHNVYFLPGNKIVYGFRHQFEYGDCYNYSFMEKVNGRENSITLLREDILLFCLRAISSTKSASSSNSFINSSCKIEENVAKFTYSNAETGDEDIKECEIISKKGNPIEFNLNHNKWKEILSVLPYRTLEIAIEEQAITIWTKEDENYFGLFVKVQL